jgi:hypothetical protein
MNGTTSVNGTTAHAQDARWTVAPRKGPTPVIRKSRRFRKAPSHTSRSLMQKRILQAAQRARFQQYHHSPIQSNEIRLLKIDCEGDKDDLHVTLKVVPDDELGRHYQYEALSYHWGEGDASNPIYVRDDTSDIKRAADVEPNFLTDMGDVALLLSAKRLYVKQNLYQALKRLRRTDADVYLWTDALCINQEDDAEKEIQVAKMAKIYTKAERVCIWLGDGDKGSDQAMNFITDILNLDDLGKFISDSSYTSSWNELVNLMRSSFFSRRWTIQEVALAREATVHCGKAEINWSDFKDAIGLMAQNFEKIRELFRQSPEFSHNYNALGEVDPLGAKVLVDVSSNIFRRHGDGTIYEPVIGLEALVSMLSAFESTDPRDTVHALRNIAKETMTTSRGTGAFTAPPPPDYKKTLLEVYTDFVRWAINTSQSLDIICRHWAIPEREKQPANYPELSVLPSWTKRTSGSPFGRQEEAFNGRKHGDSIVGMNGQRIYNASHGKFIKPWFAADLPRELSTPERNLDPSLYVSGLKLDTITWTSSIPDGVIPKEGLEKAGWPGGREEEVYKAPEKLWRTLVADRGPDGRNPPSWYHRACLHCLVKDTPNGHINTRDLLSQGQPDIVRDYLQRVQAITWNRVFLETNTWAERGEKLFGLGPPKTKVNDIVCILFGCSVPCILREHQLADGGRYFEFIGEAYIYGKMDGEAVTALKDHDLKAQTVEFRLM